MGWKTIAKKDFEKRGVGKYCMFHRERGSERGSSYGGYIEDWKCHNELLGGTSALLAGLLLERQ
jgi:hypothetical protein